MKHLILKNAFRTAVVAFSMLGSTATAAISSKPVTKDATEGAQKLYTFLVDNYGKNTISGVQTGDFEGTTAIATNLDMKAVYDKSGKYPALIGLDLLMTTGKGCGDSWFQSYTKTTKLLAREIWSKGGIPAYTWHWKDPSYETANHGSNTVNPADKRSNFDYTVAFKKGTTEWDTNNATYKEMVADIDSISEHFLDLQKDGVACIWRPLHEASGGWFWWGIGTGEQYKAFYKLMYDRMVNVNGVKNCIWVWNIERTPSIGYDQNALDPSWYPGDEYVDVIAVDVYKNAYDNGSLSEYYKKIVEKMGTDKIIALSENGPIPDVEKMQKDGSVWSWWMPWYESWSGNYVSQTSADVWKSNMASDKVITLDEMPGWGTYTGPVIVADPCELNTDLRMEAECADYKGQVVGDAEMSGGKGINVDADNGYINFKFNIKEAGYYKVIVRGATTYGDGKHASIVVGGNAAEISIDDNEEIVVGSFKLDKGENIVSAVPGWTWWVIDYARIEADEEALAPITPAVAPVNKAANESATKLYSFLYNNFGKKTISGFMLGDMTTGNNGLDNHEDFKVIKEKSGKYPALVGIDMMNATGKSVDNKDSYFIKYTETSIKLAKEIWSRGGIPAVTWHWRDPSRSTDQFYTKKGNPDGTDINFAELAIKNGKWNKESSFYKNMIKDIDVIADYMLDLQSEGVAAIFRPLHEASGGWFWWGACSGEDYAMLYRLIYDEMVNVKGVNNLIWVWNPQSVKDASWNPGDEYYDVISVDIYNEAFDNSSNYVAFNSLKDLSKKKKIIALSENGPVPDPDECYDNDATWSWWMPWYQSWDSNFANQTSNDNWKKYMASDLIITLDEMPGWDKYNASLDQQSAENKDILVFPTNIKDQVVIASSKDYKVEVVSMNGTLVENDFCAAGTKTISTSNWANGVYMISVLAADGTSKNVKVIK